MFIATLSKGSQASGSVVLSLMGYTIRDENIHDIIEFDWLKDNVC